MNKEKRADTQGSLVSDVVDRTKTRAEDYLRSPEKAKRLLSEAIEKAHSKEAHKGPLRDVWNKLTAIFRLFRAYINREYTDIPWVSIVLIVVAILYFVSAFDLILDFIPGIGFIDDAAVIAFVLSQVSADLDKFMAWEANQKKA
jgi:uncharacterized membrane protein YkvA (DUF1232 family)